MSVMRKRENSFLVFSEKREAVLFIGVEGQNATSERREGHGTYPGKAVPCH